MYARVRVGFGVSRSGLMLDSLVAVATPGNNTVQFYRTNETTRSSPKAV